MPLNRQERRMSATNFDLPGEAYVVMVRRGRPCRIREIFITEAQVAPSVLGAYPPSLQYQD
jgi:hypothetical protein